jgi:T-complex protein 1 subunit theta
VHNSEVVQGMVFKRQVEGDVTKKAQAKVAVYTCAVDVMQTETKVRSDISFASSLQDVPG